jgi:hypothetical protein
MPGVRLRHFTEPVPTVDIALAYPTGTTNPAVHHLAALVDAPQRAAGVSVRDSLGKRDTATQG